MEGDFWMGPRVARINILHVRSNSIQKTSAYGNYVLFKCHVVLYEEGVQHISNIGQMIRLEIWMGTFCNRRYSNLRPQYYLKGLVCYAQQRIIVTNKRVCSIKMNYTTWIRGCRKTKVNRKQNRNKIIPHFYIQGHNSCFAWILSVKSIQKRHLWAQQ